MHRGDRRPINFEDSGHLPASIFHLSVSKYGRLVVGREERGAASGVWIGVERPRSLV